MFVKVIQILKNSQQTEIRKIKQKFSERTLELYDFSKEMECIEMKLKSQITNII